MEFEDSRNALFVEPNAYIQHYKTKEQTGIPKVVFQQPYDCLPNYYVNNNFKKHSQSSAPTKREGEQTNNYKPGFNFDIKNLLPMLTSFVGNSNIGGLLMSVLGGNGAGDLSNIVANILKSKDIISLFGGVKKHEKSEENRNKNQTEFEIKNYTKV